MCVGQSWVSDSPSAVDTPVPTAATPPPRFPQPYPPPLLPFVLPSNPSLASCNKHMGAEGASLLALWLAEQDYSLIRLDLFSYAPHEGVGRQTVGEGAG